MLVAGLDEAGRGPVCGSLVIGCVIIEQDRLDEIKQIGAQDSKTLTPKRRRDLVEIIEKTAVASKVLELSAADLNRWHNEGLTLNQIEERNFARLINSMNPRPDIIYLDAADVKEDRFGQSIGKLLEFRPHQIISKHKGDSIFPIVGAASILAKVKRDAIIEGLKTEYGNIGSGYPSDPTTKTYLRTYYGKNHSFPPFVRLFWQTAIDIEREFSPVIKKTAKMTGQKKLTDF
jgi:ribonuclease HII